jgi:uncharacterized protein YdaU (DUF1376 family)
MPLFVGDYLADTPHLTTIEHGAYMLLLMSMWRSGGTLPSDDRLLARYAKLTSAQWARIKPTIISFFDDDGEVLSHGRMLREMARHTNAVRRHSEKSSNGGKAKALKYNNAVGATGTPQACQPEPEPESGEEAIASPPERAAARVAPLFEIEDAPRVRRKPTEAEFDRWWAAYPLKVGKLAARAAFDRAWARVDAEPDDRIAVLLRATDGFAEAKRVEGRPSRFTAHPTTWLNEGRWLDETPIAEAGFDNEQRDPKWEAKAANMQRAFAGALLAAGEGDQCG